MPLSSEQARKNAMFSIGKSGRPVGIDTRKKIAQTKAMNKRIVAMTDKLINAQAIIAVGTHKMVRMYKGEDGKTHVETIRDEVRMQNLIDSGEYGKDYVIVIGTMPDWRAGNAMLDRAFGKAKETIELGENTMFSLKKLAQSRREAELLNGDIIEAETLVLESGAPDKKIEDISIV